MRAAIGLAVLWVACGGAARPVATPAVTPPVSEVVAAPVEPAATAAEEPPEEPPLPARIEVTPPADLASAIAARLPTIELVPESCGPAVRAVSVTEERVCLGDADTGRTRAMRRFATSRYQAIAADRRGSEIVFGVLDVEETTTRYDRRLWIWDLPTDAYRGIFALDPEEYMEGAIATPFGVLVRTGEHAWVYDGTLSAVRASDLEGRPRIFVVGDTAYDLRGDGEERVVSALRREGGRILRTTVARVRATDELDYSIPHSAEALREDGTIAWVTWEHGRATLTLLRLPAPETSAVTLAVDRSPRRVFWVGDELRIAQFARGGGTTEWVVDPSTGALSPASAREREVNRVEPRSVHAVATTASGVSVTVAGTFFELGPSGITRRRRSPAAERARCSCAETTLRCGDVELAGGCAEVAELDSIDGHPSTAYGSRFRVDRLEPDYVRVTRLSDGVRLWVRVIGEEIFAQADDGAFAVSSELDADRWSVRWGRSLLGAPVSALAPVRAQLERPSLVTDFFGGGALPASDTTLPTDG